MLLFLYSRRRRVKTVYCLSVCLILLGTSLVAQANERPVALHTLKPLQLITRDLADDLVDAQLLIRGVQQAHSYSVRFSDLRQLQSAGLLIWMGPQFEHYLDKPLKALQPRIADFSWLSVEAENRHELVDLHAWLDLTVIALRARALAESLAALLPEDRALLIKRAEEFKQRMHSLDKQVAEELSPYKGKGVVVDHQGLQAFLQRYGIRYMGSLQSENHSSLSLKQARRLRKEVQLANAECVVLTQGHSGQGLLQIFSGLEVTAVEVDIMGAEADDYTKFIQRIAQDIGHCLSQ